MSKKVLVSLDMNKNEIQNVVMQSLATAPTSPKEGQYYYNSADGKAYQYVRTSEAGITPATYAWKPLGGAEITVDSTLSSTSTNPVQNKAVSTGLVKSFDSTSTDSTYTIKGKAANGSEVTLVEIPGATKLKAGLLTAADKQNIDGIKNKANKSEAIGNLAISGGTTISWTAVDGSSPDQDGITIPNATTTTAGAMSAADKTKLDGIASGANKTVVDASVTQNGNNPVTGKAIYDYVGDAIAASDAMVFKGTIGTDGTVTALPTTYKTGWTYRVITAGTYAGQDCEEGDLIIALVDRDGTGNLDSDWTVAQTNIDGAITNISPTTPITVSGSGTSRTIGHANSGVTAGSYGLASNVTPSFGATFNVPYVTVDEKGHTTKAETHKIKIPDTMAQASANGGLMSYDQSEKLDAMPIIRQDWFTLSAGSTTAKKTLTPTPSKIISVQATAISTIQDLNHHTPVVVDWEYVEDDGDLTVSIASAYSNDIEIVVLYSK